MTNFLKTAVEQLADGRTVIDLNDALLTLVAAVRHTGKKGSLTFSLSVKPASKGEGNALILDEDVKLQLPGCGRCRPTSGGGRRHGGRGRRAQKRWVR